MFRNVIPFCFALFIYKYVYVYLFDVYIISSLRNFSAHKHL